MKKSKVERSLVVLLFVMALVMYSFAQRDTERVAHLYSDALKKIEKLIALQPSGSGH